MIQGRYYVPVSKIKSDFVELKVKDVTNVTKTAIVPRARFYRAIYYAFILVLVNLFLSWIFSTEPWFVLVMILINVIGVIGIAFTIIYEYLQFIQLIRPLDRTFFNPYEHQRLFKHILYPDVLLLFVDELDLMIAMGYKTLGSMTSYFEFNMVKFIRAITGAQHNLPLIYSISMLPYVESDFMKTHFENLSRSEQLFLTGRDFRSQEGLSHRDVIPGRARQWFDWRGGMYEANHLFESYTFLRTDEPTPTACEVLCERILQQTSIVQAYILSTFKSTQIYAIQDTDLALNCFTTTNLKTIFPFPYNTRLPLIPTQTKNMAVFLRLTAEVKRGITPQLPAEFITPLSVSSEITFAKLFNTETSKSEHSVGFLSEQLWKGISISGERTELVNIWAIALLLQSIKKGIPHIIFDRDGSFSSLYGAFSKTSIADKIHYLSLGKNYHTHWEYSENPIMSHEREYRERIVNAIDIAYNMGNSERIDIQTRLIQKLDTRISEKIPVSEIQQRNPKYARSVIRRELSPSITDDLDNDQGTNFTLITEYLRLLNEGINGQAFLNLADNLLPFSEIIESKNTYILDLSNLEYEYKILAEMVFLAKIGHYLDHSNTTLQKVLVMYNPIERHHKNKYLRYDRFTQLQTLLSPVLDSDWGLLLLNTRVGTTQNHIEEICSSHIGLRTNSTYDRDALFNLLHLDEFHNHEGNSYKRQSSYQRKFLSKLPLYIGLMKREDHQFPFPIELILKDLIDLRRPSEMEMSRHFALQGLNYEEMQNETLERADLCDIRKDFGSWAEEIGKGLDAIRALLKVSSLPNPFSLTRNKLKEVIIEHLGERYEKLKPDKKTDTFDSLFLKLTTYEYLTEDANQVTTGQMSLTTYKLTDKGINKLDTFLNILKKEHQSYLEQKAAVEES
jgi:hypothetical protein